MDKVLVVGGAGFLGAHTARRLAASGIHTWATHRPSRIPACIPGVTWIESDLTRHDASLNWPKQCDSVLFLAQSKLYRDFPSSAADMFAVNVQGALHAVSYACKTGARNVVIASTGSVYSDSSKAADERDTIDAGATPNFYVATKLASEILCAAYRELISVIQVRIFFPYGSGQDGGMLFPRLIQRVKEGRPIFLHERNGLTANPIYAKDVAEAMLRCTSLTTGGVYNLAGPEVLSLREMGEHISKAIGRNVEFEVKPDERAPTFVAETRKLRLGLGWEPTTTLAAGLRDWLEAASLAA
jgi:UDP-glucose 4-epimerase